VSSSVDVADYCRQIETYLCQQNQGHLIRVVGPSFDLVAGWATQGVPLKVAFRGIDRTVERHAKKSARRRPLKIDFCEADVLDVFDEWRRATGVTAAVAPEGDAAKTAKRGPSLPEHLERVVLRLTNLRAGGVLDARADALIDRLSAVLDRIRAHPGGMRGAERQAVIADLANDDTMLTTLARASIAPEDLAAITREVDSDLARFRADMPAERYAHARELAIAQAIRDRLRLPLLTFHAL
jgi:hypothetical protein